jgi:hypothetical protein
LRAQVHRQTIKREERTERVQGEFAVTDPMKSTALRALRKAARERPTHSTAQ